MPWSRPRRIPPALLCLFLVTPVLVAGGCGPTDDLASRMDEASVQRLTALPEHGTVLASCRFTTLPDSLPPLGAGVLELGRSPRALLVEIPRDDLARLAGLADAGAIAIWGEGALKAKLDPLLRLQLLQAWGEENSDPMAMIASFREDGLQDLREHLVALGATPRTIAGPVVTLDAAPETVFRLLALPDLVALRQPRTLNLLDGS
jgi:hypothetical protein